jgi:hypothetical protein
MNVLAPNAALAPKGQPRAAPPTGFIACHQANSFDVMIRVATITALFTNAEGHAGIVTESGREWHMTESLQEVIDMINVINPLTTPTQQPASTPPPPRRVRNGEQDREPDAKQGRKQNEDHAWPPPPDDMRQGDLPKDPNHDPKNDTWERDRSDADAAKSKD